MLLTSSAFWDDLFLCTFSGELYKAHLEIAIIATKGHVYMLTGCMLNKNLCQQEKSKIIIISELMMIDFGKVIVLFHNDQQ